MADDKSIPTADELLKWPTPEQVRLRAEAALGAGNGAAGVWNRMRGNLIRTVARSASMSVGYGGKATPVTGPVVIPYSIWGLHDDQPRDLWIGEIGFFEIRGNEAPDYNSTYISAFDIRLDPAEVDYHFPPAPVDPAPQADGAVKPRIGDEPLAAWAELFKRYYPGADQDLALSSARGMFPDKHVSRDRVRALIPARKPGRPKIG